MDEVITLQKTLKEHKITPSKRYGQNFLVNDHIVYNIIRSLGNVKNKNILEIGPGIGALTNHLLKTDIKSLLVVEIHKKIIPILDKIKLTTNKDFKIIHDDALKIEEEKVIHGRYTIVANLPYNISTLLLVKWLKKLEYVDEIIIMLQKEVAHRILSSPSSHSYGRLSVLSQFTCHCELLFDVEPENFFPIPRVTSSIIKLTPKKIQPSIESINSIEATCKNLFNFRRKKINKALNQILNNSTAMLKELKIDCNKRAEQLTVDEFFQISRMSS